MSRRRVHGFVREGAVKSGVGSREPELLDSNLIGVRLESALRAFGDFTGELFKVARAELWLDVATARRCGIVAAPARARLGDTLFPRLWPPLPQPEDIPAEGAAVEVIDVIEDTLDAPRATPLIAQGLRFYACAPLNLPEGVRGALLVANPAPRCLDAGARRRLASLAGVAAELVRLAIGHHDADAQAELFRLLAENSTDTIVRGDLDGVRLYVSPSVRNLLGYEPEELTGRRALEITHPEDAEAFRDALRPLLEGRVESVVSEQRQRRRDGRWIWLEALVKLTRDEAGRPDGYVASVRDITRRKEAEARLAHGASHDVLTDLPNRALLHERLAQELSRARREGSRFALLALDLDCFKQVNDTYGHDAGDTVLRTAAQRFRQTLRAEDMVARVGGDEFVVIQGSGGASSEGVTRLATRLIEAMAVPISAQGVELAVGLSAGIVVAPVGGVGPDELLRLADQALYRAKREGRGRYHCADTTVRPPAEGEKPAGEPSVQGPAGS